MSRDLFLTDNSATSNRFLALIYLVEWADKAVLISCFKSSFCHKAPLISPMLSSVLVVGNYISKLNFVLFQCTKMYFPKF